MGMINKELLSRCHTSAEVKEVENLIKSFLRFSDNQASQQIIPEILEDVLKIATQYWLNLIRDEVPFFRGELPNISFHSILYDALINKNPINYIGILCPSYKRGRGIVGFKDEPGQTTYVSFENLKRIYENTIKMGIPAEITSFFYDIALENLEKLTDKDFDDLQRNIIYDKVIARVHRIPYFVMSKEFKSLGDKFKEVKISDENQLHKLVAINDLVLKDIIKKNCEFYPENFGWSIEESQNRALHHAYYYAVESMELRKRFKNPVVVYCAHSFEKAKIYWGKLEDKRIGVIFPKKPIGNSIDATISDW